MKLRLLLSPYRETLDTQPQIYGDHFRIHVTEFHKMKFLCCLHYFFGPEMELSEQ